MDVWTALRAGYTEPVRDVLWGHIYMTPALAELTRTAAFTRLNRILQLGPAFGVYPGATHTRASHSIGVYHLARRLLLGLAERGAEAWLSGEGAASFLCAALLHDLGHFPYTHSLKDLPLRTHESLAAGLMVTSPLKELIGDAGGDPYLAAAIVDPRSGLYDESGNPAGAVELGFYRKLLSGCLDPDKLDYLNRDARYCGVPYGAQDVDFIFSRLYPHRERGIAIDSKGIPGVESILFAKYLMYRSVYWHPVVRSSTAMIKKALLGGIRDGAITREELYNLDDQGLFALMADRAPVYPLFGMAALVRDGRLYSAVAEFPYDRNRHAVLSESAGRYKYEQALAVELSSRRALSIPPDRIIIDVPEPVSFETGLYVTDEECDFNGSSSVFAGGVVNSFVKSLRIVRIFTDPLYENKIKSRKDAAGILREKQNWINLI
jgi:HD superfamily phosphohydrolase